MHLASRHQMVRLSHSLLTAAQSQSDHIHRHGLTIPFHRNLMDAIADWDPKREALFYVIDREAGGIVAKYKVRLSSRRVQTAN